MTGSCRARCGEGHALQGHGRCRRWTAFVLRSVRRFWRFLSLALAALGLAARTHIPVGSRNRNTRLDMSADISRKQPARPGGGERLCRQLRRTLHFAFAVSGTAFPGRVLPVLVYLDRHFCAGSQRLDLLPALGQTSPPAGQFLTGGIFPPWPPKPAHRYTVHDSRAVGPATGTGVIGCRTMGPSSVLLS